MSDARKVSRPPRLLENPLGLTCFALLLFLRMFFHHDWWVWWLIKIRNSRTHKNLLTVSTSRDASLNTAASRLLHFLPTSIFFSYERSGQWEMHWQFIKRNIWLHALYLWSIKGHRHLSYKNSAAFCYNRRTRKGLLLPSKLELVSPCLSMTFVLDNNFLYLCAEGSKKFQSNQPKYSKCSCSE